jgi:hypothetical protein
MHYAFLEKFPHPATWYAKRLAYIRSVAVSSFVGYVMGIGDRHPQNILFDQASAELIHIDFGVAFDQVSVVLLADVVSRDHTPSLPASQPVMLFLRAYCRVRVLSVLPVMVFCFPVPLLLRDDAGSFVALTRADSLPIDPRSGGGHGYHRC